MTRQKYVWVYAIWFCVWDVLENHLLHTLTRSSAVFPVDFSTLLSLKFSVLNHPIIFLFKRTIVSLYLPARFWTWFCLLNLMSSFSAGLPRTTLCTIFLLPPSKSVHSYESVALADMPLPLDLHSLALTLDDMLCLVEKIIVLWSQGLWLTSREMAV